MTKGGVSMRISKNALSLLTLFVGLTAVVGGQETTGSIAGLVTDASGASLPGAQVSVTNVATNTTYKATTNAEGNYTFRTIPVGHYKLEAEASGFKRYEVTNIITQVNEVSRVDIIMAVGSLAESVEVSANVVNVNTEDASLRTVIDQRRVEDLPLNGRDPVQLMRLV